jgi:hypothetical protein
MQARCRQIKGDTAKKLTFDHLLNTIDIEKAENIIVVFLQQNAYLHEYQVLLNACVEAPNVPEKLTKSSPHWRHHPIMSPTDKLMRVNSRLTNALLSNKFKFPAILPAHCHVAKLVVSHFNEQSLHMRPSNVLSRIRQKYWIVRGHAFVHSVFKDCFSCKLCNKDPETQIMAPLPNFRLKTGGYAFETVGVDYFGPFDVKRGRGRKKRW